eukprot:750463-Hanusia_phi.AAC.6
MAASRTLCRAVSYSRRRANMCKYSEVTAETFNQSFQNLFEHAKRRFDLTRRGEKLSRRMCEAYVASFRMVRWDGVEQMDAQGSKVGSQESFSHPPSFTRFLFLVSDGSRSNLKLPQLGLQLCQNFHVTTQSFRRRAAGDSPDRSPTALGT